MYLFHRRPRVALNISLEKRLSRNELKSKSNQNQNYFVFPISVSLALHAPRYSMPMIS